MTRTGIVHTEGVHIVIDYVDNGTESGKWFRPSRLH